MGELINLQQNTTLGFNLETEQITMSSREIASLLNKNHSDIKRSAERLVASGVITGPPQLKEYPVDPVGVDTIKPSLQ